MATASELYRDAAIARQLDLQRVATWILNDLLADLTELEDRITGLVARHDPTGATRPTTQKARLDALLIDINEATREIYREIQRRLLEHWEDLMENQSEEERNRLLLFYGLDPKTDLAWKPAAMLIVGATLAQWLTAQRTALVSRTRNILQAGLDNGQGNGELTAILRGRAPLAGMDSPTGQAKRELEVIIRTGTNGIPNEVLPAILKDTKLPAHGWQQISILDNRTTAICRAYANRRWDAAFKPIGHDLPYNGGPPRHMYCRSRVILILLEDNLTTPGFATWINSKTPEQQAKLFGKTELALWKKGRLTDAELIRQGNRQLSLDDLWKRTES